MAKILSISSQVVSGHVGNSAITFALQRMGHDVLPIPTVLLSNHPGHKTFAGTAISLELLEKLVESLENNGHLNTLDGIITGYLPSTDHADFVHKLLDKIKTLSPNVKILVDPVMGDFPKGLYIDHAIAELIKRNLLPKAHIVTPNHFELQWLTDNKFSPIINARSLPVAKVLVTSAPGKDKKNLQNLLVTKTETWSCEVAKLESAPNGTGDLFAALFLGNLLNGLDEKASLAQTTASIEAVLNASKDKPELQLIPTQKDWIRQAEWPVTKIV